MIEHWMTTGLIGATGTFQRAAREYAEDYAAVSVTAELERLCAENEALRKDAERYRWLLSQREWRRMNVTQDVMWICDMPAAEVGEAIDAAMKPAPKETK